MRCDILVNRPDILGYHVDNIPSGASSWLECLRSQGHNGPHLGKCFSGAHVAWEKDLCLPGTCSDCDSEDPTDDCLVYGEVHSALELQKYLHDKDYEGSI